MAEQNNWWNNDPVVSTTDDWWSNDPSIDTSENSPIVQENTPTFDKLPKWLVGDKEQNTPAITAIERGVVDAATGAAKGFERMFRSLPDPNRIINPLLPEWAQISEETQKLMDEPVVSTEPSYRAVEETAATIAPSIVGGVGGYNLASKLAPKAPRAITYIGSAIGEALGYTISKERGKDRVFIGEESLVGGDTGISDKTTIGRVTNDFLDAVATAYIGQNVGDLVARAAIIANNAVLKPALAIFKGDRTDEIQKTVGYSILDKLQASAKAKTTEERTKIIRDLAKDLRDNEELLLNTGDGNISIPRESMGALEQGNTLDNIGKSRAGELRSGQIAGGRGALTAEKVSAPSNKLEKEFIPQTEKALGGLEKTKQAEGNIRQQAEKLFNDQYERPIVETEEAVAKTTGEVSDLLKNDMIDSNVDINVGRYKNEAVGKIRDTVVKTRNTLKGRMDDLIDQMPDDVKIDLGQAKSIIESPEIPQYIKKMIKDSDGNFKELYNKVIPAASREIDGLIKSGKGGIGPLSDLKDFINNAGPTEEFRKFYKEEWAPFFRNDKLGEFETLYRSTESRGLNPGTFEEGSSKIIDEMVQKAPFSEQLVKLLKTPEAGNKPELVTDLVLGDTASKIQSLVNSGGKLTDTEVGKFTSTLEKYGATLERIAPEQKTRIDDFLTSLRDKQASVKSLTKQLEEFKKLRDRGEKEIFDNRFKEFFKGKDRGYGSFEELLNTPGRKDFIAELMDSGDEVIQDGTKAAYLRFFKNKIFSGDATLPGGATKASGKSLDKILEEEDHILDYGKTIFKDNPNTIKTLEALTREVKRMEDVFSKSPQMTPFPYKSLVNQSSTALDKVIVLTFGVLNRMAARARAMKGVAVKYLDPMEEAARITDEMMANPSEMAKVFDEIADLESKQMSQSMRVAIIGLVTLISKDAMLNNELPDIVDEVIDNAEGSSKESNQTKKVLKNEKDKKEK